MKLEMLIPTGGTFTAYIDDQRDINRVLQSKNRLRAALKIVARQCAVEGMIPHKLHGIPEGAR